MMPKRKNIFDNFQHIGHLQNSQTEYEVSSELLDNKDVLEEEIDHRPSLRLFYAISILLSTLIVLKLINVQITHGYENRFLADDNRARVRQIEPPRGIIMDSRGVPLVNNIPSYNLELYPADLPKDKDEREKIYQKVSSVTGISIDELKEKITSGFTSIESEPIKENIDRDTSIIWECKLSDVPAFHISKEPRRSYVNIPGMSHLLGYDGRVSAKDLPKKGYSNSSRIGKVGLEYVYEKDLRGTPGQEQLEVDSKNRVQRVLSSNSPETGNNLILSIDSRLQQAAADTLNKALQDSKTHEGTAVAINPKTGAILVSVSIPYYDNNLFAKGISHKDYDNLINDKSKPLLNRAISGTYPSGSVLKPMVAAAALQEKTIAPSTKLDTSAGTIKIGQWTFNDWKVHGITDVRQAISESNDIFFYALGGGYLNIRGMGIDRLGAWLKNFSFGSPTGIDLPNESSGLVPNGAWKKKVIKEPWYIGDTYHMSIGQGYFLSTPMQVAVATTAIANNGEVLKPYLVSQIVDSKGNIIKSTTKNVVKSNFISKENIKVVKEGMRMAVTSGSAYKLRDLPFSVAAKTGTAEFGDNTNTHAWFTAFAPYEDPEIVVAVVVAGGGQGSATSAPVARDILSSYFSNKK